MKTMRLMFAVLMIAMTASAINAEVHHWKKMGGNPSGKEAKEALFDFSIVPDDSALDSFVKSEWLYQITDSLGVPVWVHSGFFYHQMNYGGGIKWTQYGIMDSVICQWQKIGHWKKNKPIYEKMSGDSLEAIRYIAEKVDSAFLADTLMVITTQQWRLDHYKEICNNLAWTDTAWTDTVLLRAPPAPLGTIAGFKFNDLNQNGIRDAGETGLAGFTIELIGPMEQIEQIEQFEQTCITAPDGSYQFNDLPSGSYVLSEVPQPNWTQTSPKGDGTYSIELAAGQSVSGKDFGNNYKLKERKTCQWAEIEVYTGIGYNGNYPWGLPLGLRFNIWPTCPLYPYLAISAKAFTSWQAPYENLMDGKEAMSWKGTVNATSAKFGLRISEGPNQHFVGYGYIGFDRYRWSKWHNSDWEAEVHLTLARFKGEGIIVHYPNADYLWSRGRGKYAIKNWDDGARLNAGAEYFREGNDRSQWYFIRYGGLLEFYKPLNNNAWYSVTLSAGYGPFTGDLGHSYAALEFSFGYKLRK